MHKSVYIFSLCLIPSLAFADLAPTEKTKSSFDPLSLYGESLQFDVMRDGAIIGKHETRFMAQGADLVVQSKMNLELSVLFIPIYGFDYQSKEVWKDNRLTQLEVTVEDGSEDYRVEGQRAGEALEVSGPFGMSQISGPILPTNHWNASVIHEKRVLNTLTGNINQVTLAEKGAEQLSLPNGRVMATRYDYQGELHDTSVWYDTEGRWVKLRFKAKDGSIIDYRCRNCETES